MAGKQGLTLNIITQDGVLYYGQCEVAFVPSSTGEIVAVLAYHTPMIMKLGQGPVSVRENHKTKVIANVKSGVMYVGDNEVSVLVNLADSTKKDQDATARSAA